MVRMCWFHLLWMVFIISWCKLGRRKRGESYKRIREMWYVSYLLEEKDLAICEIVSCEEERDEVKRLDGTS